ncbi:MAG: heavy metal translocating P-type ATPase metal-binding domain-containing protein [Bacteroidales bacterium]
MSVECIHCGNDCGKEVVESNGQPFCCLGCKTVYELLNQNKLFTYYEMENTPGIKIEPEDFSGKFAYLDNQEIANKLFEFTEGNFRRITLFIPSIHCSSCIWLLENLNRLNPGIVQSRVNFVKKTVTISFFSDKLSLRQLAELLSSIHYIPAITLKDTEKKKADSSNKKLLYKIGYAGFAFGNTMLFSFPEYIKGSFGIEEKYRILFGLLNLMFAIPLVTYSARDYFLSAYKNIIKGTINIDFPIATGMLALFLQSFYDVVSLTGAGYIDSLCGFVFFLLIGKWYQNKTYQALSFERDYKSYFPVAVTKISGDKDENILIEKLDEGDIILIHNKELIPADSILKSETANLDYSFVTGEATPVIKKSGDTIFAGGRQLGSAIELLVLKKVEQSQLTSLWNQKEKSEAKITLNKLIDKVSKKFTLTVLLIAFFTAIYWSFTDSTKMINAFVAVLIVACPCALSLSIPFAFGNTMRIFGKNGLFLKNSGVVEKLTRLDTIVFDKTGTITYAEAPGVEYIGEPLSKMENMMLKSLARHSSHPLSITISAVLLNEPVLKVDEFEEIPSKGLIGKLNNTIVKIGSDRFVNGNEKSKEKESSVVYVSFNGITKGHFKIINRYRKGLENLIQRLGKNYQLHLVSGDNDAEKQKLVELFNKEENLHFNQNPVDKLNYIESLKKSGRNVLMIGDGLNDSGALNSADVSISVADDIYHFSPACDAILESEKFDQLDDFIQNSRKSLKIVKASFVLSFIYNLVGLSFAVSANLSPVIAAILMPLSSVTVVAFVTFFTSTSVFRKS